MNDEELIKAALQLKKEEDEELAKLLEKAGFLFVPILLKYILQTEDKMDDTLQIDYEEVWEKVKKFLEKRKKKPTKLSIKVMLRGRSFKSNMKNKVIPELRKTFFGLFDEFNTKYDGQEEFDYQTKHYRDIEKWLRKLPKLMNVTSENALVGVIQESFDEGKGIRWLESKLSSLPEFSRNRARTTAITEGLRMYSGSQYEAFMQNDAVIGMTWRHTHGIKEPRKGHEEMDGQTIAKGEYFIVNGENCRYPRDPMLSAKESIHCHCFVVPEIKNN